MATRLYLTDSSFNSTQYILSTANGSSTATKVVNTANATEVQWTASAGGSAIEWATLPLTASATISGQVTFNIYAIESSNLAKAGARARLYKVSNDLATWTEMGSGPWDDNIEFSRISTSQYIWTGTPSSNNALSVGDRIGVRIFLDDNCGSALVTGYTATLSHNNAGTDSFIEVTETVTFNYTASTSDAIHISDSTQSAELYLQLTRLDGLDSITVSDAGTPLLESTVLSQSISENLETLDILSGFPLRRAVTVSDSASGLLSVASTASDSVTVTDAISARINLAGSGQDVVHVSDSYVNSLLTNIAFPLSAQVLDQFNTVDPFLGTSIAIGFIAGSTSDSITVSDNVQNKVLSTFGYLGQASDAVTVSDPISGKSLRGGIRVSDYVSGTNLNFSANLTKSLPEAVIVADQIYDKSLSSTTDLIKQLLETIYATEVISGKGLRRGIRVTDSPTAVLGESILPVSVSTSVTEQAYVFEVISNIELTYPITVTEFVTAGLSPFFAIVEEHVRYIETTFEGLPLQRSVVETGIQVYESEPIINESFNLAKSVQESVNIQEPLGLRVDLVRSVNELLFVTDSPTIRGLIEGSTSEVLALVESVIGSLPLSTFSSDSVTISEVINRGLSQFASSSDAVTVSDASTGSLNLFKSVSESVTISDTPTARFNPFASIQEQVRTSDTPRAVLNLAVRVSERVDMREFLDDGRRNTARFLFEYIWTYFWGKQ